MYHRIKFLKASDLINTPYVVFEHVSVDISPRECKKVSKFYLKWDVNNDGVIEICLWLKPSGRTTASVFDSAFTRNEYQKCLLGVKGGIKAACV